MKTRDLVKYDPQPAASSARLCALDHEGEGGHLRDLLHELERHGINQRAKGMNMVQDWEHLLCLVKDHVWERDIQDTGRIWMSKR